MTNSRKTNDGRCGCSGSPRDLSTTAFFRAGPLLRRCHSLEEKERELRSSGRSGDADLAQAATNSSVSAIEIGDFPFESIWYDFESNL